MSERTTETIAPRRPGNPRMVKGMPSLNPKGRPRSIITKQKAEAIARETAAAQPWEILMAVARRDPIQCARFDLPLRHITIGVRVRVCEILLPYIHRRQPVAVETSITETLNVRNLTDAELATVTAVVAKIAPPATLDRYRDVIDVASR